MNIGHHILFSVVLVFSIGMISILIDILFTQKQENHETDKMSKQEREDYFDSDDL